MSTSDNQPKPLTLQDLLDSESSANVTASAPLTPGPNVQATAAGENKYAASDSGSVAPGFVISAAIPGTQVSPEPLDPLPSAKPSAIAQKIADHQARVAAGYVPQESDGTFGGKRNTSFDAAHAAQRQKQREVLALMRKIIDARLEEGIDDPKWVYLTKRELAKATKRDEKTITLLIRKGLKIPGGLDALRRERLGLKQPNDPRRQLSPEEEEAKAADEADRVPLHKWNVLDLFDRLMQFFDVVDTREEADEEEVDPEAPAPRDPRLTWIAWRVFLAAAFGLSREELAYDHSKTDGAADRDIPGYPGVADTTVPRAAANLQKNASTLEIFQGCTGRLNWPMTRAKIVSLIVGRRGGKSYITAIIGIFLATRKYKLKLGTKGMVMILARDREQAGVIRGYILAFLRVLDELREQFADDPTQKLIELKNGITIEVRAAGEAGTRGYTVVAALMDEIAFWPTDPDSAKQDKKVLRALRPAMLGIKNAMIVMLSSPYAKRGELWEAHRKAYGKDDNARYLVWQADTLSMRPSDDPELISEITDEYADDPESAKAEYGAQFRTDLENIYARAALEACAVGGKYEKGYQTGTRYRAFVDPSGGSSDSYVLAIGHEEERVLNGEKVLVPVLDKIKEWVPKFDPEAVSLEVVQICKDYKVSQVTGDAYGGEWPRDPLKKRGIAYVLAEKTRSELYLDFLPVVNSGRCELLDLDHHRKALNQFSNLERRTGRTGRDSVDHPPGGHDDVANAIAGVMVGTKSKGAQECTF